ncbi:MAG: tryptophan--tRNA ligase [Actinobacteria bacterium]|nr:tryptophan--tRNA ligase [Actinomycetota bacterium]
MKQRVLSGIQPTHDSFHLGNYLGALQQWVELQDTHDAYYCIVDLHALTVEVDPALLRKRILASAAQLLAIGIDPKRSTLFIQSHVPAHNQLGWVFECITGFGEANRMTQFKDKSQKSGSDRTVVGLFTYPMLQAADILLYQPELVPVGEDQRQHIELTRDLAQRFNARYGEVFTVPGAHILKSTAKIMDLQEPTAKMSKSASSLAGVIELLDTPESNRKKIKSAVTDTGREVTFDESNKPGISNLLSIMSAITGKSISALEGEYEGKGYGDFKGDVAQVVTEKLRPIREAALNYLEDEGALLQILRAGAERAEASSSKTLTKVYQALGLLPRH